MSGMSLQRHYRQRDKFEMIKVKMIVWEKLAVDIFNLLEKEASAKLA